MCYSAQVWEAYNAYVKAWGAHIDLLEFVRLYGARALDPRIKIPKAMDSNFAMPGTDEERAIKGMIEDFNQAQMSKNEQELFKQRKRVADAQRTLSTKLTKKATEDVRIGTEKVDQILARLADIKRSDLKPRDSRIFPGVYAPVMIAENGRRVVKPMRYQCRPAGKPAFYDTKYPGTYNARRDNLEGFWKRQFGYSHGIMVVQRFFENVARVDDEGNEKNVVLEFVPADGQDMLVACLWSHWKGREGDELLSFAAITDEPPPEVAAAGHDRCIVPIKPENVDAWLNPEATNLTATYAILDDRARPYYEHRKAA